MNNRERLKESVTWFLAVLLGLIIFAVYIARLDLRLVQIIAVASTALLPVVALAAFGLGFVSGRSQR